MAKTLKLKPLPILNCYPRMAEIERNDFHADIKKNGLREKMIFWKSATGDLWLLDGRERQDGCVAADIELKIEEHYEAYPGDDPIQFVLSRKHRSHLTSSQRAAASAKIQANLPTGRQTKFGKFAELSQEDVAQLNGVSTRSVTDAVLVMEKDPELFEKVWRGEIAVSKAADQVRRSSAAANTPAANMTQAKVSQQETDLRTTAKEVRDKFNELLKNLKKKNRSRDNMQNVIATLRAFSALKPMLEGIVRQTIAVAEVMERTLPPEELTEQQLIKEANVTLNHLIVLIAGGHFAPPQPDKDGKIHYLLEHLQQLKEAEAKYQMDAAAALEKTKQEDAALGNEEAEDEEKEAKDPQKKRARKAKQGGGEDGLQKTAEVATDLGVELAKLKWLAMNGRINNLRRIETDDPSDDGYRWNAENKDAARKALAKSGDESQPGESDTSNQKPPVEQLDELNNSFQAYLKPPSAEEGGGGT